MFGNFSFFLRMSLILLAPFKRRNLRLLKRQEKHYHYLNENLKSVDFFSTQEHKKHSPRMLSWRKRFLFFFCCFYAPFIVSFFMFSFSQKQH
jgi:hypothetical protein